MMILYAGIALALLALFLIGDALRVRLVNRRVFAPVADGIERMRRLAEQEITYRAPGPDEGPGDQAAAFASATAEIERQQCAVLGDRVEVGPDGAAGGVVRWFTNTDRTVTGWFGVVRNRKTGATKPAMFLFSESESGEFFITGRGTEGPTLARPSMVARQSYAWVEALPAVFEHHRFQTAQARGTLRRFETLDEATALVMRLRTATAAWRRAQPPDELLAADVQAILRGRSDRMKADVIRILRERGE